MTVRKLGMLEGLKYQGGGPMLTFILHRIGGIGIAVFITSHLLATFFGGDAGQFINSIFMHWISQVLVFFFALFHAINGLRITILDLWPQLIPHQREAIWVEWAVFIPVFGFAAYIIISHGLAG